MAGKLIQKSGTIFMQPWWLDAVAPGQWNEINLSCGHELTARMPYCYSRKFGFKLITMPLLTQHLGPRVNIPPEAKYNTKLARQHEWFTQLIEKLPPFDYFQQRFSTHIDNWLPFYWQGFQQSTHYTYIIPDISDPEQTWTAFSETARRQVRKAQKKLIVTDTDIKEFYHINSLTFDRQGMKNPYPFKLVSRIDKACSEHGAARIFKAADASGNIHAVLYLIWDDESAYYLMGGGDPALRNSGAASLLVWEAIQFSSGFVEKFDFEGSMVPGIERFFRSFGAIQTPYFKITKTNHPLLKLGTALRSIR